jgi:hypothetical protein
MNQIHISQCEDKDNKNPGTQLDDAGFREYLLVAIRCARLRTQLLQNEIDQIGVALKARMVSPDVALCWLSEIGAIQFVDIGETSQ